MMQLKFPLTVGADGKLENVEGIELVKQRIKTRLTTRKGQILGVENLGADLYKAFFIPPSAGRNQLIKALINKELSNMPDVTITGYEIKNNLGGNESTVVLSFSWQGQSGEVEI